jgi:hypothetical protein
MILSTDASGKGASLVAAVVQKKMDEQNGIKVNDNNPIKVEFNLI